MRAYLVVQICLYFVCQTAALSKQNFVVTWLGRNVTYVKSLSGSHHISQKDAQTACNLFGMTVATDDQLSKLKPFEKGLSSSSQHCGCLWTSSGKLHSTMLPNVAVITAEETEQSMACGRCPETTKDTELGDFDVACFAEDEAGVCSGDSTQQWCRDSCRQAETAYLDDQKNCGWCGWVCPKRHQCNNGKCSDTTQAVSGNPKSTGFIIIVVIGVVGAVIVVGLLIVTVYVRNNPHTSHPIFKRMASLVSDPRGPAGKYRIPTEQAQEMEVTHRREFCGPTPTAAARQKKGGGDLKLTTIVPAHGDGENL